MKKTALILIGLTALAAQAGEMKIMSYNICHCEGMDRKIDIARTAARINAEAPDFACLQELDWCTRRVNGVDEPAELGRLTGMHPTFAKAIFFQGGQYGIMMLSREKPLNVVQVPLPGQEPRMLLLCEFKDVVVGTTHLALEEENRDRSIALIREAVGKLSKSKPVFLSGDWNAMTDSVVLKGMREFMEVKTKTDCQTYHGSQQYGPDKQPLDMKKFCIDYIACDHAHSAQFPVVDAHVVEDRVTSDHAPIVLTVTVPEPAAERPALIPAPVELEERAGVCRVKAGEVSAAIVTAREADASLPEEGYKLVIDETGVKVASADEAGFFYALQTLKQLAFSSYGRLAFPCCTITDYPRFGWRGAHLDDSRHFFGKAAVKRMLDQMAKHKLNVFHWHLTDNQGWRLPVADLPRLTVEGAVRDYSRNHKHIFDRGEDGRYGPFAYSEQDIREVVAYAAERQIRIVPEVDAPGHCKALLKAYPEYACFHDCPEKKPQGAVDNVICLGDEAAIAMIKRVFDEVVRLFPGEVIHIGGDEVDKVNYGACPKCQAKMKAKGLKDENALQADFMNELAAYLAGKGRRTIGWDEFILDGAAPKGAIIMSWRGAEGGIAAAKAGLQSVMTPHRSCYFDYTQCLEEDPFVYPWFTERLPLEKAYAYDPLEGIPEDQRESVLGGQCCNWAEYTCSEPELQWKLWPRALATAEVFWSPADRRDFADFRRRAAVDRRRLIADHVNCAPLGR